MTDTPQPVLAGHLVLYPDAIAFRPDGGTDEEVIVRPVLAMAKDSLVALFSPGPGGLLASILDGRPPNPAEMMRIRGEVKKAQRRAGARGG